MYSGLYEPVELIVILEFKNPGRVRNNSRKPDLKLHKKLNGIYLLVHFGRDFRAPKNQMPYHVSFYVRGI